MSWKDDLSNIVEQNKKLMHMVAVIQGQEVLAAKRMEALKVIIDQQIKGASRSADRMADRMIEMAMVQNGSPEMAATHRRTLDESLEAEADLWQDSLDTQWPPPGCDELRMP